MEELKKIAKKYRSILEENKNDISEIIYHYTSPDSLLSILKTGKLWFSDVNYLNDESEIEYTYQILKKKIGEHKDIINKDFFNKIEASINRFPKNLFDYLSRTTYYIASFSTNPNNPKLWDEYTKTSNKIGYNIGLYKTNIIAKIENKIKQQVFLIHNRVIYSEKEQEAIIENLLLECNSFLRNSNSNKALFETSRMFLSFIQIFSLFFKQSCFKNEQEYRIVIEEYCDPITQSDQVYSSLHRSNAELFIPYIEQEFDKKDIKEITISPIIKENRSKKSLENLLIQLEYFNINIKNSFH